MPKRPEDGTVVLVESVAKGRALPYHRKKLTLVLSAMHHFADELRADGYQVEIVRAASYVAGIAKHVRAHRSSAVVALAAREWGLSQALAQADRDGALGAPLELHDDGGAGGHFVLTRAEFAAWARGRKQLRMDQFYRWMRKRMGVLMDGTKPVGGAWSFDSDNRKPPGAARPPVPRGFAPDAVTARMMERVRAMTGHWGEIDGFDWPVTRADALVALDDFVVHRAPLFGDYQDAMLTGHDWMWHARLSAALNLSLLSPGEVVERVLAGYRAGAIPLNAAEGFVRQVIGWREFIRGIYWLRMPALRAANQLRARRPLPDFFWDPERTDMRCLAESVRNVRDHGYAHHIQRLMVLGNFALLAEIAPIEVSHWFWAGFVDAYEWVELPNVHGMALYADGAFTTKPYAASASYIHRMSDYCGGCRYQPKRRVGVDACPFNSLYWRFMVRHRERLAQNPRMAVLYRSWDRWDSAAQQEILDTAERFLDGLAAARHGWGFDDDGC